MAAVRALFDGFLSKLDSLDPSKTLSGMRLPSLTGSVSKKTSSSEDPAVDTDASTSFHDVVVEARHRPEAIVGEARGPRGKSSARANEQIPPGSPGQ